VDRVEEVEAHEPPRVLEGGRNLGDRETGGVRREDGVRGRHAFGLAEHGLLELDVLGDRLDHEVGGSCRVLEVRRPLDAVERRLPLLGCHLVPFDPAAEVLVDGVDAVIDHVLVYVP